MARPRWAGFCFAGPQNKQFSQTNDLEGALSRAALLTILSHKVRLIYDNLEGDAAFEPSSGKPVYGIVAAV
jgi:hypothetical protein